MNFLSKISTYFWSDDECYQEIQRAIMAGNLETLKFFKSERPHLIWDYNLITDVAAFYGYTHVMNWTYENSERTPVTSLSYIHATTGKNPNFIIKMLNGMEKKYGIECSMDVKACEAAGQFHCHSFFDSVRLVCPLE